MKSGARWNNLCSEFARDEDGATVIEYGLIVALIFLVIVVAVRNYATKTNNMYSTIASAMPG